MSETEGFPGLTDSVREQLRRESRDWSGLGVDPDAELRAARESYPDLRVVRKQMIATSPVITIDYEGYRYDLGRFVITAGLTAGASGRHTPGGKLRVRPVQPVSLWSSICHPHISTSGRGCWGQLVQPYALTHRDGRWGDLLDLVVQMLSSVSPAHGGQLIMGWERRRTRIPKEGR